QDVGCTYGGNYKINWVSPPKTILIVRKQFSRTTHSALVEIATWLYENFPYVNIVVEKEVVEESENELPFVKVAPPGSHQKAEYTRIVDFVISLGGDGTMLHVSSLFDSAVPPVVSFSMGTLGFLMPFQFHQYKTMLEEMMQGEVSLALRMRLLCSLWDKDGKRLQRNGKNIPDFQVMNEVNLHRGRYPHLTAINCFVNGQFWTDAVADGLIVATPTGSTAYSLSAGGPIIHPSVQSLLLTPICPRSLSFRPVILPPNAVIQLRIGDSSRSSTEMTVDGREVYNLTKGEYLEVQMSPYPVPTVSRTNTGIDWLKDVNDLLKWNQSFGNKQLLTHGLS
ncbi:10603_t:CDS:10, partial [Paraglomus occultum]